jgi:phage gp46-like protein
MADNSKIIISLTDILDQRIRKEQEIEYYEDELKKIESKLFFLRKEKELTELIIQIIEDEKVIDLQEHLLEKKTDG